MRCDLVNIKLKSCAIKERQNGRQQKASPTGRGGTAKAVTERGEIQGLRLDDIQHFVLMIYNPYGIDDIHTFGVMIYKACALMIYTQEGVYKNKNLY